MLQIVKQLKDEPNRSAAILWAHSDDMGMLDAIGHMLESEFESMLVCLAERKGCIDARGAGSCLPLSMLGFFRETEVEETDA